jgi:hypothetical protein
MNTNPVQNAPDYFGRNSTLIALSVITAKSAAMTSPPEGESAGDLFENMRT